jgi:predicted transcriptional regulator
MERRLATSLENGVLGHLDFALSIYMERQRRKTAFLEYGSIFGEPAWDLLLCTFITMQTGSSLSLTDVAKSADLPLTTAQRHAHMLEKRGLLIITRDKFDCRRNLLSLSHDGESKMRAFLERNFIPMRSYPLGLVA